AASPCPVPARGPDRAASRIERRHARVRQRAGRARVDREKETRMLTVLWIVAVLVGMTAMAYVNASGRAWAASVAVALVAAWVTHALPYALTLVFAIAFVVLAIPLAIPSLRR